MFIPGGKKGSYSGGDVGGKKEEVTAERMLKGEIAQQITEVKEQIRSFLRHRKGRFLSQTVSEHRKYREKNFTL